MIKAISTMYQGRRFRSRLEARWAIFFDAIDVGWEYEVEGFEIGSTKYLTDFKISSFGKYKVDAFIEIKPNSPTREEIKKCYEVANGTGINMLLICGAPGIPEFLSLGDNWRLKKGYVALYFPASVHMKGQEQNIPFDVWMETNRFHLFQTSTDGVNFDAWPIYFEITETEEQFTNYSIVSNLTGVHNDLYGITSSGNMLRSIYLGNDEGRSILHDRIVYGYELATSARFEYDEFNVKIVKGFYDDLNRIPFKSSFSEIEESYALYYNKGLKKFTSKKYNEERPPNTITLVKKCPPMIIKQFVLNYTNRTSEEFEIMKIWKGFLFRYRIQLINLKVRRTIAY